MATRIITLQRQIRELGRLRPGWTDYSGPKPRPVKSRTWVVTSTARPYVEAAAEAWGGTAEQWQPLGNGAPQWRVITEASTIDALLPPGDPINQAYETWSAGGCARRCDGETESLSGRPCICRAQYGDEWHQRKDVCKPTTRLGLILSELPDLGIWRMETHGYYAGTELPAIVDLIRSRVDSRLLVPVTLGIEPRTRVVQGKTKQFIVVTVGIRGASAAQILSGSVPALAMEAGPERQAIEAGSAPALPAAEPPAAPTAAAALALVPQCTTLAEVRDLWRQAAAAKVLTDPVKQALKQRSQQIENDADEAVDAAEPPAEVVEAEEEPNVDMIWSQVINEPIVADWGMTGLETRITDRFSKSSDELNGWQLLDLLKAIQAGELA